MQPLYVGICYLKSPRGDGVSLQIISKEGTILITTDYKNLYKRYESVVHVYQIDFENSNLVLTIASEWAEAKLHRFAPQILTPSEKVWDRILQDLSLADTKQ